MARTLFGQGDYEGVLKLLPAIASGHHGLVELDLGRLRLHALANLGQADEALAEIGQVLAAYKTMPDLHYLHASLLEEAGETVPALAAVRRALFLNGDFIMGHVLLGHLLAVQGKSDAAGKSYRQALKLLALQPDDAIVPESESLTAAKLRGVLEDLATAVAPKAVVKGGRR